LKDTLQKLDQSLGSFDEISEKVLNADPEEIIWKSLKAKKSTAGSILTHKLRQLKIEWEHIKENYVENLKLNMFSNWDNRKYREEGEPISISMLQMKYDDMRNEWNSNK
jgi:hypothetical protein